MGRVVSIDYGIKRIGLAISDENRIIASSLGVLLAQKTSSETIKLLLQTLSQYDYDLILIGNPVHLNGKVGFLADEVEHFAKLLRPHVSCEVRLWDERLSTSVAERSLKEGGMSRKKRSKVVDAVAAIIILQSFLGY